MNENEQMVYGRIRAEKRVDGDGTISVQIHGSASQYPFLVLPDFETIRQMRNFLDHLVHTEFLKKCQPGMK